MIVVISGSWTITNYEVVAQAIAGASFKIDKIIHGGAKGVDTFAEQYARKTKFRT